MKGRRERSSGKTSSMASCDISDEEKVRRKIRERNLKRNKMVRTIQDESSTECFQIDGLVEVDLYYFRDYPI